MATVTQEVRTMLPRQEGGILSVRGRSFAWIGVVPYFLYVALFLLLPTLWLAIGAFQTEGGHFTLEHVRTLFQAQYVDAYPTSLMISLATALALVPRTRGAWASGRCSTCRAWPRRTTHWAASRASRWSPRSSASRTWRTCGSPSVSSSSRP